MLFPPQSFAAVEDGIYRSGFPTELNFSFIETLNLKSVIILSSESVDDSFVYFLESCEVQIIIVRSVVNDGFHVFPSAIAEENIIEALNCVTNRNNLVRISW